MLLQCNIHYADITKYYMYEIWAAHLNWRMICISGLQVHYFILITG